MKPFGAPAHGQRVIPIPLPISERHDTVRGIGAPKVQLLKLEIAIQSRAQDGRKLCKCHLPVPVLIILRHHLDHLRAWCRVAAFAFTGRLDTKGPAPGGKRERGARYHS